MLRSAQLSRVRIALLLSTMVLGSFAAAGFAAAADVARDIREGRQDETTDFSAYLEIGAHVTSGQSRRDRYHLIQ